MGVEVMGNIQIVTIKDALINAPDLLWSDSLFLPDTLTWELETTGVICDPDEVESEDEEIPQIAKEMGLPLSIGVQDIQQVVDNARQQVEDCSIQQLFEAFLYYYDNDAFIDF